MLAQPRLPCRIGRDVCPTVAQQIGLDCALAGSRQVSVFVRPGIWAVKAVLTSKSFFIR